METIYLNMLDSTEKIPFTLSYGKHRELQEFLMDSDKLFHMLTDTTISDTVLKICLSERNNQGQVIKEFDSQTPLEAEGVLALLDFIFDYFSKFFLSNQEKTLKLSNQVTQISQQSQAS